MTETSYHNHETLTSFNPLKRWVFCTGEPLPDGKIDKQPLNPRTGRAASLTKPATWGTRAAAEEQAKAIREDGWKPGVGVVLGDGLCGVDFDGCLKDGVLEPWAEAILGHLDTYAEVSPSGEGVKAFFRVADLDAARKAVGAEHKKSWMKGEHYGVEIHLSNSYYVVTGQEYGSGLVGDYLRPVSLADLRAMVAAAERFKGKTRDESGSGHAYRFCLNLATYGLSAEEIEADLRADNGPAGEWAARVDDRQIQRCISRAIEQADKDEPARRAATMDRFNAGIGEIDPITARLNERFALARHAGRTLVVEFTRNGFDLGGVEDLHTWHAHDLVPMSSDGKRMEPASKRWLRNPHRREFSEIVFDPTGRAPDTALNLWTGWAVEPDRHASCDLILAHIRDVLANGDRAHARYIVGYLADMVQNPGRKPGVALVLKGGKGAGKDTLAVILRLIVGKRHVAHITRPDALTQRFNAPFATALVCHVEEAFWSGAQDKKGTLQALITSETMPIEKKGVDTVEVDSFLRLIMTTNESWAVPASHDERRYAVFDVSDSRMGDKPYFDALYAEIEGDGPAAFLAYLLDVDLSEFKVRDVPQTEALRDQKLNTLRGVGRWWFEFLHKGDAGEFEDWEETVTVDRDDIRGRYESFIRENRHHGDAVNSTQFGHELRKMLPGLGTARPRVDGKLGPRVYIFPPLQECRAAFCVWLGAALIWEDDE